MGEDTDPRVATRGAALAKLVAPDALPDPRSDAERAATRASALDRRTSFLAQASREHTEGSAPPLTGELAFLAVSIVLFVVASVAATTVLPEAAMLLLAAVGGTVLALGRSWATARSGSGRTDDAEEVYADETLLVGYRLGRAAAAPGRGPAWRSFTLDSAEGTLSTERLARSGDDLETRTEDARNVFEVRLVQLPEGPEDVVYRVVAAGCFPGELVLLDGADPVRSLWVAWSVAARLRVDLLVKSERHGGPGELRYPPEDLGSPGLVSLSVVLGAPAGDKGGAPGAEAAPGPEGLACASAAFVLPPPASAPLPYAEVAFVLEEPRRLLFLAARRTTELPLAVSPVPFLRRSRLNELERTLLRRHGVFFAGNLFRSLGRSPGSSGGASRRLDLCHGRDVLTFEATPLNELPLMLRRSFEPVFQQGLVAERRSADGPGVARVALSTPADRGSVRWDLAMHDDACFELKPFGWERLPAPGLWLRRVDLPFAGRAVAPADDASRELRALIRDDQGLRRELTGLLDLVHHGWFEIGAGRVQFLHPGYALPTVALRPLVALMSSLLAEASGREAAAEFELVMLDEEPGSARSPVTCPVCGDDLSLTAARRCPACETPHHPECWDWAGGCATYACPRCRDR